MKRFVIKNILILILLAMSVWGFKTLDGQGTITQIIAESPIYYMMDDKEREIIKKQIINSYADENSELSEEQKQLIGINEYKKPDIAIPLDAYEHTNGLNHGKYLLKDITEQLSKKEDSSGRIISLSKKLTKTDSIMTVSEPLSDYEPDKITMVKLLNSAEVTNITSYIYKNAIEKYNSSITYFILKNNQPVIMQINLLYKNQKDRMPYLINYKAFSADDYGKSLNINTDFYNHIPKYKIDYEKFKLERVYTEVE